ncbi:glycosyltransferase family 4 protein [Aridibaculum aurantiacum]|uniref:glycosyltransferase family 4 protein n=1 Tax=Aridibaculum aurantiacum TaxID=2810307 RepID=UPI001A9586AD|nr:glycosyltransferase family 4 protein [Aridibaculum aurantiacum]
MPKLLSVVWYKVLPARYGGQKGIAQFNKYLSQIYPLVCVCSSNNEPADNISYSLVPRLPVSKLQFINPLSWRLIFLLAKQQKTTHIILEHPYHGIAGWICKILLGVKLVVHSHNIEYERFREQGKWWWKLLQAYEQWTHRQADLNFFKTQRDLDIAEKEFALANDKCVVVPYGIERVEKRYSKAGARKIIATAHDLQEDCKIVLFAGTLDYAPNAKAVEDIYKHIAPSLPGNFKIIICGRNQFEAFQYLRHLKHPAVIYAGEVEDIDMYYAAADVFINPLAASSGIQTKTIDALQHDLNVVCFAGNVEGLPVELVKDKLFIAINGNWSEYNKKIIHAASVDIPTSQSFFDHFDWEKIVQRAVEKML